MLPAFFIKTPAFPDEVLKYREPVDPAELLAGRLRRNSTYLSVYPEKAGVKD